ncbi:head-tail adaptor protein [Microvirga sp. STS02]|uniref:head-tail adaptor protein n=1 Tax=Hymenobacter negativus TaxID=2795026 RepID=UPI0018DD476F|nr:MULTISPECIES: head-tail adaptor protein [Bacteria]MBH8569360.1 head-tail adaptor protein [Hymenobacter negativus]MBR7209094.1 head-tail adaptor protein [Microvirga sp. STS02]
MSNIGKRDRQIQLLAPAPAAQNGFGESAPAAWADQGTEFAQVIYPSAGQELVQAAQQTAVQPVQFVMRCRADVRPTWQVDFEGVTHLITAVTEIGRRQGLILTTQRRG